MLAVTDLAVGFDAVRAVDGVSFELSPGEVLAIVGESGSGKSVTVLTLLGLTRTRGARFAGAATFDGLDLLAAGERELQRVRGREIAMIFQDPMTALNPVMRVGDQIVEQIRAHEAVTVATARSRAAELLERAGIGAARLRAYPHELSGGMRQRAMIAMALSCGPRLVIADEPTTALDVTTQAQIVAELRRLCDELGTALIIVTHDLGVVAEVADRVLVMYAGRIVERAPVQELFADPRHPYTWGLLGSIARMDGPRPRRLPAIPGAPPAPDEPIAGCAFRARCPHAHERCGEAPPLAAGEHADRCWLALHVKRRRREHDGRVGLVAEGAA